MKKTTAPIQRETKTARVNKLHEAAAPKAKGAAPNKPDAKKAEEEPVFNKTSLVETREEKRETYQVIAQAETVEVAIKVGDHLWIVKAMPPNPHILRVLDFDYQRTRE